MYSLVQLPGGGSGDSKGAKGGGGGDFETSNFAAEYAKSGRAKCRGCDDKIEKVSVYT